MMKSFQKKYISIDNNKLSTNFIKKNALSKILHFQLITQQMQLLKFIILEVKLFSKFNNTIRNSKFIHFK
jgi:hypothetical protein